MSNLLLLLSCLAVQDADLENVVEYQKQMTEFCKRVSEPYVFIGGGSGVVKPTLELVWASTLSCKVAWTPTSRRCKSMGISGSDAGMPSGSPEFV